jgi:RNA polymerase sigma factor (sigma-70 family)
MQTEKLHSYQPECLRSRVLELSPLSTQSREIRLAVALRYCIQLWDVQPASPEIRKLSKKSELTGLKLGFKKDGRTSSIPSFSEGNEALDLNIESLGLPFDTGPRNPVAAYLHSVKQIPHLNVEDELSLFADFQRGSTTARDELIRSNLWLVPVIVRKYAGNGVHLEDLIEEGNLALFTALEKFDASRGIRFSTYAKWWVLKSSTLARQKQAHAVAVPRGIASVSLNKTNHDTPTEEPTSDSDTFELVENSESRLEPSNDEKTFSNARLNVETVTLDQAQAQIDEKASDAIGVGFDSHIEQSAIVNESIQFLLSAVSRLSDKERLVIEHRYELNGKESKTLQELAAICGLSAERIRKIQLEAMEKLKTQMFPDK